MSDNPLLSTLTLGQHRRYLQLTNSQQRDRRTEHERKELKSLKKLVYSERSKYKEAVNKFFLDHKNRFSVGFRSTNHPASGFCRWTSSHQKLVNNRWKNETALPLKFGKCRQILSFQSQPSCFLDIESLKFQVVHESRANVPKLKAFPTIGSCVPLPNNKHFPNFVWLKDDTKALELAIDHKTTILTTAESLEALLQLPGEYDSRWIFYATTDALSKVRILDIPIAQSLLPRTCLEKGIQEGLQQSLQQEEKDATPEYQYIYSLWTLPTTNSTSRRNPVRVLVRSTIRLVDTDNIPICLRSHAEYFPERGVEKPTLYEKAIWILDQLLLEHRVKTRFARINVQTCQILDVEETSVAHAFAAVADEASNPLLHWQILIQVLSSIPTIDISNALLCLPSQGDADHSPSRISASVHSPVEKNTPAVVVDLESTLEQADSVALNADALYHCSLDWIWQDAERVPCSFPLKVLDRANISKNIK
jgi:hypothetical protein